MQAERNRNRLPPKRKAYRWTRRIVGVIATIAFIGVGVAIAQMVLPDKDGTDACRGHADRDAGQAQGGEEEVVGQEEGHQAQGPDQGAARGAQGRRRGRARQGLHDAQAERLRPQGDASACCWAARSATPRVASRAFFFAKEQFLGNDALNPSTKLTVAKTGKLTVTLSYGVYASGDTAGDPSDRKRVRFRLEAGRIHALDTIPLDSARFQRPKG